MIGKKPAITTHRQPAKATTEMIQAEVSAPEQQRRGRIFVSIYSALVLLAAAAFVALSLLVRGKNVLGSIDVPLTRAVQSVHLPMYSWMLTHTSDLGWFPLDIVSYVLVFAALFALRLRLEAILAVSSSLLADGLGSLIKDAIGRARPSGALVHVIAHLGGYSFPSGHVIQYTTLFGFTFWVVWIAWRSSWLRNMALALLFLLVALVGPSRVYLGQHWPTDVMGAYVLAGLWVAGTIEVLLAMKARLTGWWSGQSHRRRWTAL